MLILLKSMLILLLYDGMDEHIWWTICREKGLEREDQWRRNNSCFEKCQEEWLTFSEFYVCTLKMIQY